MSTIKTAAAKLLLWWRQWRCPHPSCCYRTEFYNEGDLPMCICTRFCWTCGKDIHRTVGVDWGTK